MKNGVTYTKKGIIYESPRSIVYKGEENETKNPVVLKTLRNEYPSNRELEALKYEFEIGQKLVHIKGVVRYLDLYKKDGSCSIVMEELQGKKLDEIIKRGLSIKSSIEIAIRLAETLGEIHKAGVIHKDINPGNIMVDMADLEIKVIDFGIACFLEREEQKALSLNDLEGTLPYLSPEQTGRMNRVLDYRTDYYSLGATFYEMLTKVPPFQSDDSMELVHAHIAKIPISPSAVNSEIPAVLSEIIMKLLSKNAEDRYQSTEGLLADLRNCLRQIEATGRIPDFTIGKSDYSGIFHISQKLYGREKETQELLRSFAEVCEDGKTVLGISGHSGIGKTVLIQEIYKPLVRERGFFLSGKHDRMKAGIPFFGLIQALRELTREILSESPEKLAGWSGEIKEALDANTGIITEFLPEMENVIGKQPEVRELPPQETQNRFQMVFLKFLGIFARKEHPLVIFLDDLQWADTSTLSLLEYLSANPELKHIFLIVSYRDNEVGESHPVFIALKNISEKTGNYREIRLKPLDESDVTELAEDTFQDKFSEAGALSHLVYSKTKGNPFFTAELLKKMYSEKIVQYSKEKAVWEWNEKKAGELSITDNVVDLMIGKIGGLHKEVQEILQTAACVGDRFNIRTLMAILEKEKKETYQALITSVREELILPVDLDYRYEGAGDVSYRFAHDRVRQAAYEMLGEQSKIQIHYKAGCYILKSAVSDEEKEDRIFDIVNHLNLAKSLIKEDKAIKELIELNAIAARKAKASSAFQATLDYTETALGILGEESWESKYEEMFKLWLLKYECLYLTAQFEESEKVFDELLKHSRTRLDRAKVYEIQTMLFNNIAKYKESIESGVKGLNELGIIVPFKNAKLPMILEILKAKSHLRNRKISDLINAAELKNPSKLQAIRIASNMMPAAFMSGNTDLWVWLIVINANITLKGGNSDLAANSYMNYGAVLSAGLEDYKLSYEFGKMALQLEQKYNNPMHKGKNYFVFAQFISQWGERYSQHFLRAYQYCLEGGDPVYAGYAISNYLYPMIYTGYPISKVIDEYAIIGNYSCLTKDYAVKIHCSLLRQIVRCLAGITRSPVDLSEDGFDEDQEMKKNLEIKNYQVYCLSSVGKIMLLALYGEWHKVLETSDKLQPFVVALKGTFPFAEMVFYTCLSVLRIQNKFNSKEKKRRLKELKVYMGKMKKWSGLCPENFSQRYHLLLAEEARLSGDQKTAMQSYHMAIDMAVKHEHTNIEALACEFLGEYYLELGARHETSHYLHKALAAYQRWEVKPKIADFQKKYERHLPGAESVSYGIPEGTAQTGHTFQGGLTNKIASDSFDLASLIKSTQAISRELNLNSLLENAMKILLENAGARKGAIILEEDSSFTIRALGNVENENKSYNPGIPLEENGYLPVKIVSYVLRSREDVILNRLEAGENFRDDKYLKSVKPKSLLCLPIVRLGICAGALYLENDLTEGAFTEDRLTVLRVLAAQIAVSVENTRLIGQLREKERLQKEMEIAERIQTSLIPQDIQHNDLEICGVMKPALEVGGDYFDFQHDANGNLWFSIGDVSGHGVTPGLIMMMAQSVFANEVQTSPDLKPSAAMKALNGVLYENIQNRLKKNYFMTMLLVQYKGNGQFCYSGAGHTEIVIYREASGDCEIMKSGGIFLCQEKDISEFIEEKELQLETGDILFLYTDGIIESREGGNGQLWGMNNFLDVIRQNAPSNEIGELKSKIFHEALSWCKDKQADDMTLIIIKKK